MKLCGLICRSLMLAAGAMLATTAATSVAFAAEGPFHVEHTWQVGGEGGWDYIAVDPQTDLLYITRGDHVQVVNRESGKQVADITGLHGTHGVVFAKGGNGYISDGRGNQVAVFDRKTFKVIRTIPAGTNPDGILYEPVTRTVWAFNGRSHNVTVIDTKDDKVLATLELPGKPEFPVADGKGNIYDNIEDKSEIVAHRRTIEETAGDVAGCAWRKPIRASDRSRERNSVQRVRQPEDGDCFHRNGQGDCDADHRGWSGRGPLFQGRPLCFQFKRRKRNPDCGP